MPMSLTHDDDGYEPPPVNDEPPFEFYIIGTCDLCEAPFFNEGTGAFCLNAACPQSEEALHERLTSQEAAAHG